MTNQGIDTLWYQAMKEAIQAHDPYTRYRFAQLVFADAYERGKAGYMEAVEAAQKELIETVAQYIRDYHDLQTEPLNGYDLAVDLLRKWNSQEIQK